MRVWLNRLSKCFWAKVCLFSVEVFGWVWWWSSSTCSWIANYWLWNHKSIPRYDTTATKLCVCLFSLWWLPKSHWPQVIWMRLFELQHYLCRFDQLQRRFFLLSKLKHDTMEVIKKMEDFLWNNIFLFLFLLLQPYCLWSMLGVGGFRGPMFRCFGKETQSVHLFFSTPGHEWRRGTEVVVVPFPTHLYSSW